MLPHAALSLILEDPDGRPVDEVVESLESHLDGLDDTERWGFNQAVHTLQSSAQTALPGVAQGAMTGAALGPWGALLGGIAGGATSLAAGPPKKPPATVTSAAPAPLPTTVPVAAGPAPIVSAPSVPATPPPIPPQPTGGNPAAQLLAVIQDPHLLQALASLVAGPLGKRQVPVGSTSAPPAAFLNLLSILASQAGSQAEALDGESVDSYLRGKDGDYTWDVASPEARARALLEHLRETAARSGPELAGSAGSWLLQSGLAEVILDPI